MSYKYKTDKYTLTYNFISNNGERFVVINGMEDISEEFKNNPRLIIPSSINGTDVFSIDDNAFSHNEHIRSVVFENGVKYIGRQAFVYCPYLVHVRLPESLREIKYAAFYGSGLKTIEFKEGLEVIGKSAFCATKAEDVFLPDSLIIVDNFAFAETDVSKVRLGKNLKIIGVEAFESCRNLQTINLPERLTSVGAYAFRHCNKLRSVVFPDNLLKMEHGVFDYCNSLESVYIGAKLTDFNSREDFAFGCPNLKEIKVSPLNDILCNTKNAFYDRQNGVLIRVFNCENSKSFTVPKWVKEFANFAFNNIHLDNLIIKSPDIKNLKNSGVSVDSVYCIPNSSVDKYFKAEYLCKVMPLPPTIGDFLEEISDENQTNRGDINE